MLAEEKTTIRGFRLVTFNDVCGQRCSLQKSSLAYVDALWLGFAEPESHSYWDRMHLTQPMVQALYPFLQSFVEIGNLDTSVLHVRGRLTVFFGDWNGRPCLLEEGWYQREPILRFGVDLTERMPLVANIPFLGRKLLGEARMQLRELVMQARKQDTGETQCFSYQMRLSQHLMHEVLPYLGHFAKTGQLPLFGDGSQ